MRRFSILVALACGFAIPAHAANIHIEADTYFTKGQIPSCGYDIARVACDAATEGYAVDGVDCDGEWIAFHLDLPSAICFHVGLQSARYIGLESDFLIEFRTDDAQQTLVASDTITTPPGLGAD